MIFFSVLVLNMMFVIYSKCISTQVELEKYARPGTVGIEPTTFPTRWDIFQARPVWIYAQSNITNIKKQFYVMSGRISLLSRPHPKI
jgi:hypothetical protein